MSTGSFKPTAFSLEIQGKARDLRSPCRVSHPFDPRGQDAADLPQLHDATALWDTGATHSAITKRLVKSLGLNPVSQTEVHGVGGAKLRNEHLLNIYLPNNAAIPGVRATECDETLGNFDLIIGMGIIAEGDFAVTSYGGNTTMSFRLPSTRTIDFVRELKEANDGTRTSKVGRNDRVLLHKQGEDEAAKLKHKHAKKLMDNDDSWEMIGAIDELTS